MLLTRDYESSPEHIMRHRTPTVPTLDEAFHEKDVRPLMSLIVLTARAEVALTKLLADRQEECLIVVDIDRHEAQVSLRALQDLQRLQQDIEMVGPFWVSVDSKDACMFVRTHPKTDCTRFELDRCDLDRSIFQVRELRTDAPAGAG